MIRFPISPAPDCLHFSTELSHHNHTQVSEFSRDAPFFIRSVTQVLRVFPTITTKMQILDRIWGCHVHIPFNGSWWIFLNFLHFPTQISHQQHAQAFGFPRASASYVLYIRKGSFSSGFFRRKVSNGNLKHIQACYPLPQYKSFFNKKPGPDSASWDQRGADPRDFSPVLAAIWQGTPTGPPNKRLCPRCVPMITHRYQPLCTTTPILLCSHLLYSRFIIDKSTSWHHHPICVYW